MIKGIKSFKCSCIQSNNLLYVNIICILSLSDKPFIFSIRSLSNVLRLFSFKTPNYIKNKYILYE